MINFTQFLNYLKDEKESIKIDNFKIHGKTVQGLIDYFDSDDWTTDKNEDHDNEIREFVKDLHDDTAFLDEFFSYDNTPKKKIALLASRYTLNQQELEALAKIKIDDFTTPHVKIGRPAHSDFKTLEWYTLLVI